MAVNPGRKPLTQRKLLRSAWRARAASGASALAAQPASPGPDPVMVATLAIDHIGPATVRAVANGVEVYVTAPDEATTAVFRAVLADTARRRSTDCLVRIIID